MAMAMAEFRVRTVTCFARLEDARGLPRLPEEAWERVIGEAGQVLDKAKLLLEGIGYEVQTIRLATQNMMEFLDLSSVTSAIAAAKRIEAIALRHGITFVSLGGVDGGVLHENAEAACCVEEILLNTNLFCNVHIDKCEGLQGQCSAAAALIRRVSAACESEATSPCFKFTVCSRCPGSIPYFPAAYWNGKQGLALAIGCENSGLLWQSIKAGGDGLNLEDVPELVRVAFEEKVSPLVRVGDDLAEEFSALAFLGVDASVAPGLDHKSIVEAFELIVGPGNFGGPGTLAVASMITKGLKAVRRGCGYSGLMLPVCEDEGLAKAYSNEKVTLSDFLSYSSVCGVGLDTVPISGDATKEKIAGILMDVVSLAIKWDKPLSCRLLPCPGKGKGDKTDFKSPYLVDCIIQD
ncbi:DUF711 domain-containing protein [Chloropicon primus]|uniref:DUF711 domain-containing protein n=1 Tax=Chloropicon primus TaxID=1764295 RepID=A0A5B8MWQ8_9CHLO|nr:DUF711 domain-containing protein [Chloropicon primus]|eukprot:QDZ24105.1 DUF711 domain-containing protein [Chloropicon primus]